MAVGSVNEVRLVGRLSGEPAVRVLPSGDPTWLRLVRRVVPVDGFEGGA